MRAELLARKVDVEVETHFAGMKNVLSNLNTKIFKIYVILTYGYYQVDNVENLCFSQTVLNSPLWKAICKAQGCSRKLGCKKNPVVANVKRKALATL